jgi:hypothetical protein
MPESVTGGSLPAARTAFALLSDGPRGEHDHHLWRGTDPLFQIARKAASPDPEQRHQSVAELADAWQAANGK